MRNVRNVKSVAPKQMIEHTPMKLLANSISWGLKYMLEQGGAQSWVPRNDDPRPGLVFSCSGHQNPRSLLVGEVPGDVSVVVSSLTRKHGSSLIGKNIYIMLLKYVIQQEILWVLQVAWLWISYLSHCSSGGQLIPKTWILSLQSDMTVLHSSLHGWKTMFSKHAGKKAWHRKWWTFGEQRSLISGMNGWEETEK